MISRLGACNGFVLVSWVCSTLCYFSDRLVLMEIHLEGTGRAGLGTSNPGLHLVVLLTEVSVDGWGMVSPHSLVSGAGSLHLPVLKIPSQKSNNYPILCPQLPSDICLQPCLCPSVCLLGGTSVLSQVQLDFKAPNFGDLCSTDPW